MLNKFKDFFRKNKHLGCSVDKKSMSTFTLYEVSDNGRKKIIPLHTSSWVEAVKWLKYHQNNQEETIVLEVDTRIVTTVTVNL